MRTLGLLAATLAILGAVSTTGTVQAQNAGEQQGDSDCNTATAAPGNREPTLILSIEPAADRGSNSFAVTAKATDPDGDDLSYIYTISWGSIIGEGSEVTWDLEGSPAGFYSLSVFINDGRGCYTSASYDVEIKG